MNGWAYLIGELMGIVFLFLRTGNRSKRIWGRWTKQAFPKNRKNVELGGM
jgi:hypothetical protein